MLYQLKFALVFAALFSAASYAQPTLPWVEIESQDQDMHPVLWAPLARAGDPQAQFNVGLAHSRGDNGYKLDHQKALHWLTLSAEQGYPAAENNLAIFYASGRGIPLDHSKARYWFKRASAHRRIGVGYENLERIDRVIAGVDATWEPPNPADWEPAAGKELPATPPQEAIELPTEAVMAVTQPSDTSSLDLPAPASPKSNADNDTRSIALDTHELNACSFPPEHFTLQLVGASSRSKIEQYVSNGNWLQPTGYIHTQHQDNDWFVVIHGDFATREAATLAKKQLTDANEKLKPWLRSFASLNQYCSNHVAEQ